MGLQCNIAAKLALLDLHEVHYSIRLDMCRKGSPVIAWYAKNAIWRYRLIAFGCHLGISAGIAALAALLVFGLWYPSPYHQISGGSDLFLIVICVDAVLGPLITLAVFNCNKSRRELMWDLSLVGAIQLAALAYGLWTVALARPVHLVFELDRFRVVHAIDIPDSLLGKVPTGITARPLWGPTVLGLRGFKDAIEKRDATWQALQGLNFANRPDFWQPYSASVQDVRKASKSVTDLRHRFIGRAAEIDAALDKIGRTAKDVNYLPMVSRGFYWTAILDPNTAEVLAFVPLDSF